MRAHSALVATATIACACARSSPRATVREPSAAQGQRPAAPSAPLFDRQVALRDLTGDGHLDSLILEARGRNADSLEYLLRIVSPGHQLYLVRWNSSDEDESEEGDSPGPTGHVLDSIIHSRIRNAFASSAFTKLPDTFEYDSEPSTWGPNDHWAFFISEDLRVQHLAQRWLAAGRDTAGIGAVNGAPPASLDSIPTDLAQVREVAEDIERNAPLAFAYEGGLVGANTTIIAWSKRWHRFFTLYSCC